MSQSTTRGRDSSNRPMPSNPSSATSTSWPDMRSSCASAPPASTLSSTTRMLVGVGARAATAVAESSASSTRPVDGNVTANSLPWSRPLLCASTAPPCSSTMRRTTVKPMPRPPSARLSARSSWTNKSNTCGNALAEIPMPLSRTRKPMFFRADEIARCLDGLLDEFGHGDPAHLQCDLAFGHAGRIEQIVEQPDHVLDLAPDHREERGGDRLGTQHGQQLDSGADRREGVSQFVRQHRQELVLPPAGGLCRLSQLLRSERRHDQLFVGRGELDVVRLQLGNRDVDQALSVFTQPDSAFASA